MKQIKEESVVINNKLGLHARACSKLVALASGFNCEIFIVRENNNRIANAKSLMAVMMLAANMGTLIKIIVKGTNLNEMDMALNKIVELIKNKFGESE